MEFVLSHGTCSLSYRNSDTNFKEGGMLQHGRGGKVKALTFMALVFLLLFSSSNSAWSQTVEFDAARVILPQVGETFNVQVMIEDVTNLGGFQVTLDYDPTVVQILGTPSSSVTLGSFIGSTGRTVTKVGGTPDNTAGTVAVGAFTTGSQAGPSTPSGTPENLVTIIFTVQSRVVSELLLHDIRVTDTSGVPFPDPSDQTGRLIRPLPMGIFAVILDD